ncbi:MAG: flagellar biosynthesis anti-sigma factor FlgM [Acidobacteriota bacterium]
MSVQNTNLTPTTPTGAETSVQGQSRSQRAQETDKARGPNATGTAVARAADPGGDDVQLSGLAQHIQTLKTAVGTDSPEHQARVEALAKAYSAGTYTPDAQATAVGIVDDAVQNNAGK